MPLNCLIIDDEPLAREGLLNYCREIDFLTVCGTGANPLELTSLLEAHSVDLLFLDIQMPIMNGMEFLRQAKSPPLVILTTAFPSYAVESFQLDVLDYLLKPITFNRFYQAAVKAKERHTLLRATEDLAPGGEEAPLLKLDHFFVKCEHKYEKIHFADVLFVRALQNYVIIQTTKGKYITLLYLKNVAENLASHPFLRVHKSYIVATEKIEAVENNHLVIEDYRIPISRSLREEVMQQVVDAKLWRK